MNKIDTLKQALIILADRIELNQTLTVRINDGLYTYRVSHLGVVDAVACTLADLEMAPHHTMLSTLVLELAYTYLEVNGLLQEGEEFQYWTNPFTVRVDDTMRHQILEEVRLHRNRDPQTAIEDDEMVSLAEVGAWQEKTLSLFGYGKHPTQDPNVVETRYYSEYGEKYIANKVNLLREIAHSIRDLMDQCPLYTLENYMISREWLYY